MRNARYDVASPRARWGKTYCVLVATSMAMPQRPVVQDPRNALRSTNRNRAAHAHQRRAHHQRRTKGLN